MGLKLHLTSKLFFALSKPEHSVKATYSMCQTGVFPGVLSELSHGRKTFELLILCPGTKEGHHCHS